MRGVFVGCLLLRLVRIAYLGVMYLDLRGESGLRTCTCCLSATFTPPFDGIYASQITKTGPVDVECDMGPLASQDVAPRRLIVSVTLRASRGRH